MTIPIHNRLIFRKEHLKTRKIRVWLRHVMVKIQAIMEIVYQLQVVSKLFTLYKSIFLYIQYILYCLNTEDSRIEVLYFILGNFHMGDSLQQPLVSGTYGLSHQLQNILVEVHFQQMSYSSQHLSYSPATNLILTLPWLISLCNVYILQQ